ncbi:MAG TPA: SDR family oxidoreductase [Symbiobacteriaceae bacterium]|jgi:3-oxoacyl-[acyl-carrier protein] reductase
MGLEGKVAVVTGGSRGIGAATVRLLAGRGATVVVNYVRSAETAGQLVSEIEAAGGRAKAVQADISKTDDIRRLIATTMETYGRIDILISNAATMDFAIKPFLQMTWDEFAQKLNDEMRAAFELTQAVLPIMQQQHYGRIVYVSAELSKHPHPGFIALGAAKAALNTFCKYVAQECGQFGVTANIVSPGLVETDANAHQPAEQKARVAAMTPLRRLGQPDDVAGAIAFFASDDSKFLTGTYAPVNGGSAMD